MSSVPAIPSPTCQISWVENGQIVTDGLPAVVVAFFYTQLVTTQPTLAPMVSMCQNHLSTFNPREYTVGLWTFKPMTPVPATQRRDPDIERQPKLDRKDPMQMRTFINPGPGGLV